MSMPVHPYHPLGSVIPHYVENISSVPLMIAKFFFLWAIVIGIAWGLSSLYQPITKRGDRLAFIWFCLTASIHFFFEGYFAVNHATIAGRSHLFAELWKEYSLSDSRYLRSDAFLVCMESITAICWGPLGFFIAYCILSRHPARYALQIVISLGQLYGDALYYSTSLFDLYFYGTEFSRPERYYFWCYYFLMNFFWIMIPTYYLVDGIKEVTMALRKLNEREARQKQE